MKYTRYCAALAVWTALAWCSVAMSAEKTSTTPDILIRNVTVIDQYGGASDRLVNILVRAGKLDLISEDEIPASEAWLVEDARGGFILGKLEVGSAPNFLILTADPRERFEVLLDTDTYASFALHNGEVVRNRLAPAEQESAGKSVRSGWLAYTPPPMALPLSYRDASKWNRFDTKYVSGIFVAGLLLDRMNWLSQNAVNESQFGDLAAYEGGEIRGFRLGFAGTLNLFKKPWVYTVFGATNAFDKDFADENLDSFTLFDWRLDIPLFERSAISIGKQKEPFSGERIQPMTYIAMQERSAVSDAMLPARNIGIVWNGYNPEQYSSWAFGVFNNWFDTGQDFAESASQFSGRVTWAPLRTEDASSLLHLGLSYRYSNGKEGFRFGSEPEFNQAPLYLDTGFGTESGVITADHLQSWNAELAWRRGPYWIAAEYTGSQVKNAAMRDPEFNGWWVAASWILTGEMRSYNRKSGTFGAVPISRDVYQNGKGAWELSARWSTTDLADGPVQGGKTDVVSLGLTWWATPFLGISANYRYIWNELDGEAGTSSGFNTRIMVGLE